MKNSIKAGLFTFILSISLLSILLLGSLIFKMNLRPKYIMTFVVMAVIGLAIMTYAHYSLLIKKYLGQHLKMIFSTLIVMMFMGCIAIGMIVFMFTLPEEYVLDEGLVIVRPNERHVAEEYNWFYYK